MAAPPSHTAGTATSVQRRGWVWGSVSRCRVCGGVVRRFRVVSCPPGRGLRWPALHVLRITHPQLAGLVMRNEERAGLLVDYRYSRQQGFHIIAVYPRWRWVPRLLFRHGPALRSLAGAVGLVLGYVGFCFLCWLLFGTR